MLASPPQNKTWHGRLHKSGEKQQKSRHYSLYININKYSIVMITVYRHHIRAEKEEWKTILEINMPVKMINVMTGRKHNRTHPYLLQLIIHILDLLTKLSLFLCFSFYSFTVLWKHVYFTWKFTVYSQVPNTGGVLIVDGVGIFPKI